MSLNDDLEEELGSHIQHRADDLERSGLDRVAAERRARIEFGGRERVKEECRDAIGRRVIETVVQDVRFGLRVLRKSPGFALVAILTLALAIAANAVVFGVGNGFILRPLNVPGADSLYGIEHATEHNMAESYPDYVDLRDRNRSFDGLAAYGLNQVGVDSGDDLSRSWIEMVSGNYFDVLRIQPSVGYFFHATDEHGANSAPYIVLSHAYWHTHFHDDRNAVGRVVRLNKHPFTIVGVAPPGFHGTLLFASPDFFVPFADQEQIEGQNRLNVRVSQSVFMTLGHLKAGVTPEQAVADLNSIGAYLAETYPNDHGATTFVLARPGLYGNRLGAPLRAFVSGLMLLAGLILVAACANLGSVFAARTADRSREIALRLALGASRRRVLRQLLTEAVLISLVGGAVGLAGSVVLLRGLSVWQPVPRFPMTMPVAPDPKVYALAVILAVASGLLFGIVPFRHVRRADSYQVIKAGPSGTAGRKMTIRDLLLVAQVAICGVLVTASMVAARGLVRSLHNPLGFEPQQVLLVETDLTMALYTGDQVPAMQKRMIDAIAAIPEVTSVGATGLPPLAGGGTLSLVFADRTTDLRPSNAAATAQRYQISPDYFRAAGTTLLAGRAFSWHDDKDASRVAVVNRQLATTIFGTAANAVDGQFKLRDGARVHVVGVVEDGKYDSLTEDPQPAVFFPLLQMPINETWLVVRSTRDLDQLGPKVRATLRGVDAGLPVYMETWNQQLNLALFPSRMATIALGVMGGMGAVLAVTGIFGMAAYSVSKRLKELGIRLALGARRQEVLQAALGRAFKLLALGSGAGLVLGLLATRVLSSIVYQATPRDPLVLGSVVFVMFLLGLFATWVPARRALRIDPLLLLREE